MMLLLFLLLLLLGLNFYLVIRNMTPPIRPKITGPTDTSNFRKIEDPSLLEEDHALSSQALDAITHDPSNPFHDFKPRMSSSLSAPLVCNSHTPHSYKSARCFAFAAHTTLDGSRPLVAQSHGCVDGTHGRESLSAQVGAWRTGAFVTLCAIHPVARPGDLECTTGACACTAYEHAAHLISAHGSQRRAQERR